MIVEVVVYNLDESLNISYEVDIKRDLFKSMIFWKRKKAKKRCKSGVNKNRK